MSLETQVQNVVTETARRWKALRGQGDDPVRVAARAVVAKLAFATWLLAGNLLRIAAGKRAQRQVLGIRALQQRLRQADDGHLLAMLDHAVETVLWHIVLARRDGHHLRAIEHLVADFLDDAENDLTKLSRLAKG